MNLPSFKTKRLWIGNILYFENNIGMVSKESYLAVKTKGKDKCVIISDDENLPSNLLALLGVDSRVDDINEDNLYLINAYNLSNITELKKLSFENVVQIAKDTRDDNVCKVLEKSIK